MSRSTATDKPNINAKPGSTAVTKVSKQAVIDMGLQFHHEAGFEHICRVCIASGGSCCSGCEHLLDGVGCQLRNTSCTAWLCGFLKYVLYEMDLLQNWDRFWKQVPGRDYRTDFTPDMLAIRKPLIVRNIRAVSEALARDLMDLADTNTSAEPVIALRELLDKLIEQLNFYKKEPQRQDKARRNIERISEPLHRFHEACAEYRQDLQKEKINI